MNDRAFCFPSGGRGTVGEVPRWWIWSPAPEYEGKRKSRLLSAVRETGSYQKSSSSVVRGEGMLIPSVNDDDGAILGVEGWRDG